MNSFELKKNHTIDKNLYDIRNKSIYDIRAVEGFSVICCINSYKYLKLLEILVYFM